MTKRQVSQSGFTLLEVMMALAITAVVTGAIVGLIAAGQGAFQREPEIVDRQQAIRIAMDSISRDVLAAGQGLPVFAHVFTTSDPSGPCSAGLNGCGTAGAIGTVGAAGRGGDSIETDVIEMLGADETCPAVHICSGAGGTATTFATRQVLPPCLSRAIPGLGIVSSQNVFAVQPFAPTASGGGPLCPAVAPEAQNGALVATAGGLGAWNNGGVPIVPDSPFPVFAYSARIVRYAVAPSPATQAPSLWRSATGRFAPNGVAVVDPGQAGFDPSASPWRLVAEGIEDMQFEYFDGTQWTNAAPPQAAYANLVQQVRITLSARVVAPNTNMQGATSVGPGGTGPDAIRGQLVSVVAPRRNLTALQMAGRQM